MATSSWSPVRATAAGGSSRWCGARRARARGPGGHPRRVGDRRMSCPAGDPRVSRGRDRRAGEGDGGRAVVLVGHSYAGCVISGVADRVPERVGALALPGRVRPRGRRLLLDHDERRATPLVHRRRRPHRPPGRPAAVLRLPATPHPLATLLQRSRLSGAWRSVPVKHYAAAAAPEWWAQSPFVPTTERLRGDPDWTVHDLPSGTTCCQRARTGAREDPAADLTAPREVRGVLPERAR